jgi:hypothetical protein
MIDVEQICNFEQASDRIDELLPQIDPEVARILSVRSPAKKSARLRGLFSAR